MGCGGSMTAQPAGASSLSCDADWRRVHELRERYDAVAVGGLTWLLDKPRLNVRPERLGREPKRQPARVIFAGGRLCLVTPDERMTYVIGSNVLTGENILFNKVEGRPLGEPLAWLYQQRIRSMLVEGGPTLLCSFIKERLVDRLTVFVRAACAERALNAVCALFGGLPEPNTHPFGAGILLEWNPLEREAEIRGKNFVAAVRE
jgi:riboflavin biosynthesis pyrimidine reductase